MEVTTIKALTKTSPPRIRYKTYHEASERIAQLETMLGISQGKPIWNLDRAILKIKELESLLATIPTVAATLVRADVSNKPAEQPSQQQNSPAAKRGPIDWSNHALLTAKKELLEKQIAKGVGFVSQATLRDQLNRINQTLAEFGHEK